MSYLKSVFLLFAVGCVLGTYGKEAWRPPGCSLPAETGPCKASIKAWYYDSQKKTCKPFVYGGCGGNGNNFESRGKCDSRCGRKYKRKHDQCLWPPKKEKDCRNGSSQATRWYFSETEGACKRHIFKTCLKDPKGFATCTECLKYCQHHMLRLQVCEDEENPK